MSVSDTMLPHIALLGAGIFVRTQYIPRLRELVDYVVVKTIWSRTEESVRTATELARGFSPNIDCKWGEAGLDDIIQDRSIHGVAIVLAGQVQVDVALRMLKAGKHVIQEKPAAESTSEAETALSDYSLLLNNSPHKPIWALAENYRFEPAFVESRKLMTNIGEMMNIQVIVEGSMNSSNPYFSSSWRRKLHGGFIVDMGVHFIAGLRMIHWRFVGSKGTLQVERGNINGRHGYSVLFYSPDGNCQSSFYPFSGVTDELKAFFHDISRTIAKDVGDCYEAEPRSSFVEGARDVAVLEAMLESSKKEGALVRVKAF